MGYSLLLLLSLIFRVESGSIIPGQIIAYRVLYSDNIVVGQGRKVGYVVSVESNLGGPQIEELICRVLSKEAPPAFSMLVISVYYSLEEYIPPIGAPVLEARLRDHELATYRWNVALPDARNRLTVFRNTDGDRLVPSQGFDFDHSKCSSKK